MWTRREANRAILPSTVFAPTPGLASLFRGALDKEQLGYLPGCPPSQFAALAQTVGYPPHP